MALLGLVPAAQAELRVSKNYRLVSDPSAFRFKDMPAIAVNPNNPNHVVQVNANNLTQDCEGTASFDGGTTWSAAQPFALPPTEPGTGGWGQSCRVTSHAAEAMYQTVAFGSGQNVYATYITPQLATGGAEQTQAVVVVRSTDGGRTWTNAFVAMRNGANNTGPD